VTQSLYVKVRRNVLDVTYHVSQYQNIIAELKGEIERLKDKMNTEPVRSSLCIFRGCYY
jgi:kinesin family protein 18/19